MTLLRSYEACGMNLSWLYDPDEFLDLDKKQKQEEALESLSLVEIADLIEDKIDNVRRTHIDGSVEDCVRIGDVIDGIMEEVASIPDIGTAFYDRFTHSIFEE